MACQALTSAARLARNVTALPKPCDAATWTRRTFQSSSRLLEAESRPLPPRKPLGAFRGGLFGFLIGATSAGGAIYYYVLEEYKVSNEMLMEDISALQSAVGRIESYVRVLEDKVQTMKKEGGSH